ncbi:MAG: hypothetical protein K5880_08860 [Hydrogenophaga sp.]|uniref:hypothetical protein n=1 Tax=Hydrogenophaga sp. TaxID=1904254 RepID=UPI00261693B9|nr:hypothetical protein [Hydrogenophaga sp.]MCV0438731.1 hypothetical protein [Hydrogenophaga sp.]
MPSIRTSEFPANALLARYREGGAYTDCYAVDVGRVVSQAAYVEAFYTSTVFKVERQLLAWFVSKPATDHQARLLASGQLDAFSAWTVEGRTAHQLLLCDFQSRTRSWLMSAPVDVNGSPGTRLYFGSAVVPVRDRRTGQATMGWPFRALLGFHKLYSRVLVRAALSRLSRTTAPAQ